MNEFIGQDIATIAIEELRIPRAKKLAIFLALKGPEQFANLESVGRNDQGAEVLTVRLGIERPQECVHDIRREETVSIIFYAEDTSPPHVLAMRGDFPSVPHMLIGFPEGVHPLCLYDEPWVSARIHWTPSKFIQRIHLWFSRTAEGTLHGRDQPLEPLLAMADGWLVCPKGLVSDMRKFGESLKLCKVAASNGEKPLLFPAPQSAAGSRLKATHIALLVEGSPKVHGIIRMKPRSLYDLIQFCQDADTDLVSLLRKTLTGWLLDEDMKNSLEAGLMLLLVLPKTRVDGGLVESWELRAFLTDKSIREVGVSLDVYDTRLGAGKIGYVMAPEEINHGKLMDINLSMFDCLFELDARTASNLNGAANWNEKIVAIGAGSLGSQIILNLAQAGKSKWCILDGDTLLPHNIARHALDASNLGINKAVAVGEAVFNRLVDAEVTVVPVDLNLESLDPSQQALINDASLVCDFTASVPVSRYLAAQDDIPRCIAAFLSPNGRAITILIENSNRTHRLDWLEMIQYREVISRPELRSIYSSPDGKSRYGGACRDVTFQIAQHRVAMWAALGSRILQETMCSSDPAVIVVIETEEGGTQACRIESTPVTRQQIAEWLIVTDRTLIDKLAGMRSERLPTETGGILIGAFDMERKVCYLVDALGAPPDSIEMETRFERGLVGLRDEVAKVESLTAGQLTYVGEWHSHPDGCAALPSCEDAVLHQWLVGNMILDGLPGVMMIIGERDWSIVV